MYSETIKELRDKLKAHKFIRFYGFTPRCLDGKLINCPYGVYGDTERNCLIFSIDINHAIVDQCQNSDAILKACEKLPDNARIKVGYCDIQGNHIDKDIRINIGNGMIVAVSTVSRRGKVK